MLRIILADDHADVRKGIIQILSDEFNPVHIEEAGNGRELIEKVLEAEWDVVISDLVMPGINGLDALKDIRKKNIRLPVIIISSSPADQYRDRVLEAGAIAFISKEHLPAELIKVISVIVNSAIDNAEE